jgi:hypothetical protein
MNGSFGFRIVVTSVRVNALARTVEVQVLRFDQARTSKEHARIANKATSRP